MKNSPTRQKKIEAWVVLDPDGDFGDNNRLRFGRMGAELCRAQLMVEDWKEGRGIRDWKVVPCTITLLIPKAKKRR